MKKLLVMMLCLLITAGAAHAEKLLVHMHLVNSTGVGESIGTITVSVNPYGTVFTSDVHGITPGLHGFHVHQNPNCGPGEKGGKKIPGLAAGGHYDPSHTGRHEGPYGKGHLGDLPPLPVGLHGKATHPVLAPRIKITDLKGRALIIHERGDNYSDHPEKLGGGGSRIACGIVK